MSVTYDLTGNVIVADGFSGPGVFDNAAINAIAALTDNSGGTADDTIAAIPAVAISSSGGNTYADSTVNTAVNLAITPIKNDIADLTAKVNAILAAIKA